MTPCNILAPVDGSKDSDAAVAAAGRLAQAMGGTVHLLYVVNIGRVAKEAARRIPGLLDLDAVADFDYPDEITRRLEAQGEEAMDQAERRLAELGVAVTRTIHHGPPASHIVHQGRDADLIALGRRGAGNRGRPEELGPTARQVLREFPAPLLLAGPDAASEIKNPLLAYDGLAASHAALPTALDFCGALGVTLTILHLPCEPPGPDRAHVRRHLADHPVPVRWVEGERSPAGAQHEQILRAAAEWKHDLVILGAWGYGFEKTAGDDAPVEIVARRATAPVLILS
jgi:nucleotide-binding universal stress UspA family protein